MKTARSANAQLQGRYNTLTFQLQQWT